MKSLSRPNCLAALLTCGLCFVALPAARADANLTPPASNTPDAARDAATPDKKPAGQEKRSGKKDKKKANNRPPNERRKQPEAKKPKDDRKSKSEAKQKDRRQKRKKNVEKKEQDEKRKDAEKKRKDTEKKTTPQQAEQKRPPAPRPPAKNPRQAATRVGEADADFAWQGEYVGYVYTPRAGNRRIGLQVIALGDAAFDGVVYSGGLPGAGWDRRRTTTVSGIRRGALLSLAGELLSAEVQPTHAVIRDTSGKHIGTLQKTSRRSPTLGKRPPHGAIVLFDGTSTDEFEGGAMTENGLLKVGPTTKRSVEDFYLHLEFRTPYMPYARGQGRANSGVYIQRRYEVQILDSFGLSGEPNECGGLYRQKSPDVNMALPPLSWQTYDIYFTAARFDDAGEKIAPARITVLHNGVAVHSNYAIKNKTGAGRPEGPQPMPILLQNHGNPVVFRNIWMTPLECW